MDLPEKYVEELIARTWGDVVSIGLRHRTLGQFGFNPDLDNGVREQVWATGGVETLPTGNTINRIVSTDAADTMTIRLLGHTLNAGDFTYVAQEVTLNGTTPVTLTTSLARIEDGFVLGTSASVGTITVYVDGGATHLTIRPEAQQSEKCALTVASDRYLVVTGVTGSVLGPTQADVDFSAQVAEPGGVFRERWQFSARATGTSHVSEDVNPPAVFPPNSDVRMMATSDANNVQASATLLGVYAAIHN